MRCGHSRLCTWLGLGFVCLFLASASAKAQINKDPTVATEIPDRTATSGISFNYTFPDSTFADVDSGDTLTYTSILDDGTALSTTWLSFAPATRAFSDRSAAGDVKITVNVTADDGNGGKVSDDFDIVTSKLTPTLERRQLNYAGTGILGSYKVSGKIPIWVKYPVVGPGGIDTTDLTITCGGAGCSCSGEVQSAVRDGDRGKYLLGIYPQAAVKASPSQSTRTRPTRATIRLTLAV